MRCLLLTCALSLTACASDPKEETDETDAADTDTTGDTLETDDPEAPSDCAALVPYSGTYDVLGTPTGDEHREPVTAEHARGTVIIGADCAVDYDQGLTFTADEVQEVYDRTTQEFDRRVQVSYDADDNGRVINVYLTDTLEPSEIQYRHRDGGVNIRVLVGPAR